MPTGVCKRVIIVYHELCGKSQGLHNCVLRYVRKSPQKINPVRLGCLFGITKESDFRLASLAARARVCGAMQPPKKLPHPPPIRPHKCLKPARLSPDGLHLLPINNPAESTAIGLTFIRQNTHASTRACYPTGSLEPGPHQYVPPRPCDHLFVRNVKGSYFWASSVCALLRLLLGSLRKKFAERPRPVNTLTKPRLLSYPMSKNSTMR